MLFGFVRTGQFPRYLLIMKGNKGGRKELLSSRNIAAAAGADNWRWCHGSDISFPTNEGRLAGTHSFAFCLATTFFVRNRQCFELRLQPSVSRWKKSLQNNKTIKNEFACGRWFLELTFTSGSCCVAATIFLGSQKKGVSSRDIEASYCLWLLFCRRRTADPYRVHPHNLHLCLCNLA